MPPDTASSPTTAATDTLGTSLADRLVDVFIDPAAIDGDITTATLLDFLPARELVTIANSALAALTERTDHTAVRTQIASIILDLDDLATLVENLPAGALIAGASDTASVSVVSAVAPTGEPVL